MNDIDRVFVSHHNKILNQLLLHLSTYNEHVKAGISFLANLNSSLHSLVLSSEDLVSTFKALIGKFETVHDSSFRLDVIIILYFVFLG